MSKFGVESTDIISVEIVMSAVQRGKVVKKVTDISKNFKRLLASKMHSHFMRGIRTENLAQFKTFIIQD